MKLPAYTVWMSLIDELGGQGSVMSSLDDGVITVHGVMKLSPAASLLNTAL